MNRETPEIPQGLPAPLDLLLRRCFQFNPQIRPSFRDMYETFRTPWHVQGSGGDSVQSPTTPANDILRPGEKFDHFTAQISFYLCNVQEVCVSDEVLSTGRFL